MGCRFSYEVLSDDQIAGLPGGSFSGGTSGEVDGGGATSAGGSGTTSGAGTSAAGSGGTSTGGTGSITVVGDYVVTTGVDESDAGATVSSPGGSGLSLREAIDLANAANGSQVISIEPGITVNLNSSLPDVVEAVEIAGNDQAVDGSNAGNSFCLRIDASDVWVHHIEVLGCGREPIFFSSGTGSSLTDSYIHQNGQRLMVSGTGATIARNLFENSASTSLGLFGTDAVVRDNRILDAGESGIFLDRTANGATIVGNLIVRANRGITFSGLDGASVWHNTIVSSVDTAISLGQATSIDLRNNILSHAGSDAVNGTDDKFTAFDYNLFFSNGGSDCSGCSSLPGSNSLHVDPSYGDFANDDFTLQSSSPAIDAGVDTGEDRNGSDSGNFDGTAPDLGYVEMN